jgi:hypothetical protein
LIDDPIAATRDVGGTGREEILGVATRGNAKREFAV